MPRTISRPGVSRSTRIIDCWRCRSADGSVLPITMKTLQSGFIAPVIHHLRPLMTYSSPSRTMDSSTLVASDEATSGSVMAKAERIWASSRGRSHCCFCSSVPNMCSTSMLPVSGALQLSAAGAIWMLRPVISAIGAYCRLVRPPSSGAPGSAKFHRPRLRASARRSSMTGGEGPRVVDVRSLHLLLGGGLGGVDDLVHEALGALDQVERLGVVCEIHVKRSPSRRRPRRSGPASRRPRARPRR